MRPLNRNGISSHTHTHTLSLSLSHTFTHRLRRQTQHAAVLFAVTIYLNPVSDTH